MITVSSTSSSSLPKTSSRPQLVHFLRQDRMTASSRMHAARLFRQSHAGNQHHSSTTRSGVNAERFLEYVQSSTSVWAEGVLRNGYPPGLLDRSIHRFIVVPGGILPPSPRI